MPPQSLQQYGYARFLASTASLAIMVLGLCSCQTDGLSDITGSLGEKPEKSRTVEPVREEALVGLELELLRHDAGGIRQHPVHRDDGISFDAAGTGHRAHFTRGRCRAG